MQITPNSVGGCFGGGRMFSVFAASMSTPVPGMSSRAFERVFSVLREFTPEPVEFVVETTSFAFDARASISDNGQRKVHMMLGLLLGRGMDDDALAMVACHELGHHFGGAPSFDSPALSYEGQADYYSGQGCFHFWMARTPAPASLDPSAEAYCRSSLRSSDPGCARAMSAALKITKIVAQRFQRETTDLHVVDRLVTLETLKAHPSPQCRLDTMKASYGCHVSGSCSTIEQRPACWYAQPLRATLASGT